MSSELATVSFRTESGVTEDEPWPLVDSAALSSAAPWRTFRWYHGQRHYSGFYRSATMRDHASWRHRPTPLKENDTNSRLILVQSS
jgi:hypothetical protein